MEITREIFEQQRRPRFGNSNPERMQVPFWEWMIRGENVPSSPDDGPLAQFGLMMRNGVLKSANGPWRARDLFDAPANREDGPIWTFDRMGQTSTGLPDGRVIYIGGEHEDFYDPDFYIYNDVVVFSPHNETEIYGYPRSVFPPTDFHTATLVSDQILIIGCIGYPDDRRPGRTPVFALDLANYQISEICTSGEGPGWIYGHEAKFDDNGIILVRGGKVVVGNNNEQRTQPSVDEYELDTRTRVWRRLTNKNWT